MKLQITVEGKTYEVEVEVLEEDESACPPRVGSYPPASTPFESAFAQTSHDQSGECWGDGGQKVCRSPITGLVIKVNVQPGQHVETNSLIAVLEAMKMETNVTAPGTGTVKRVNVSAGDPVKVNQVLVEFE